MNEKRNKKYVFIILTFRQPRRKITVVDFDKCQTRMTKCMKQKKKCSDEVDAVCGSDANTYTNQCHLNIAICMFVAICLFKLLITI